MRTIREFIELRASGKLQADVTWRNYAIEDAVKPQYARNALARLHYRGGELGYSNFAADYGVPLNEAEDILACWWLWAGLRVGKRPLPLHTRFKPSPRRQRDE
jgi:hypothetical protein